MTSQDEVAATAAMRREYTIPDVRKNMKLVTDFDDLTLARCESIADLEQRLYDVLCEARVIATWASPEGVSAIDQAYIQIVEQNEIKDGFDAALATDYARGIVEFIANVFHNLLDPDSLGLDPDIATETRLKEFHEATTREDDPSA